VDYSLPSSTEFKRAEAGICGAMAQTMWSLHSCYANSLGCAGQDLEANMVVIVDRSINYPNKEVGTTDLLVELDDYPGKKTALI